MELRVRPVPELSELMLRSRASETDEGREIELSGISHFHKVRPFVRSRCLPRALWTSGVGRKEGL